MSDALQRRSMAGLGLFHLRGGVVPTGSNLETPRERQFAMGYYVRVTIIPTGIAFFVKVGGAWKAASIFTKVGGTWKSSSIGVKVSGSWVN